VRANLKQNDTKQTHHFETPERDDNIEYIVIDDDSGDSDYFIKLNIDSASFDQEMIASEESDTNDSKELDEKRSYIHEMTHLLNSFKRNHLDDKNNRKDKVSDISRIFLF
jgi:hypothetical protein